MNYCIINGEKVYPALGNKIKVTKENSLIKDRDAQTMEIEFPLSIYANRKFFGILNRIDVMKRAVEYGSCTLYSNDRLIIRGKATITTVSNVSVKLQIVSGVRLSASDANYSSIYIDEIDAYQAVNVQDGDLIDTGVANVFALPPVYDETNDIVLNRKDLRYREEDEFHSKIVLSNIAIQPYLAYVARMVFRYLGYELNACVLDEEPWSRLLIYNNKYSVDIKGALPHWSVKTFLDELRKLFNIGYVYDEEKKTVSIHRYFDSLNTVEYECLDEFNTDYDEEGLEYIGSSNLVYNLSDSEENKYADIGEELLTKFSIKEYVSMSLAQNDIVNMSEKEKMTTVFHFTNDPFGDKWGFCKKYVDEDGNSKFVIFAFGWFMHLRRDNPDNNVELNMVPCASHHVNFDFKIYLTDLFFNKDLTRELEFSMPSSTNETEYTENETLEEYVSVEDYFENGNEPAKKEEAERMELYFNTGKVYDLDVGLTDDRKLTYMNCANTYEGGSFDFEGGRSDNNIGMFHYKKKRIENKEQVVIKFLADDVPDPKNIFIFRNKKFLCDKIEMEINDKGFNKLMTGYFYEMTS